MPTLTFTPLGNVGSNTENFGTRIVEAATGAWYAFYHKGIDLGYRKSTTQGLYWGAFVPLYGVAVKSAGRVAIWYDRWTPGDSGSSIHIALLQTTDHDVVYFSLDTSSDVLSSPVTVFDGASLSTPTINSALTITKLASGKIAIVFDGDGGTETGHYVASSPYSSWTSKSNPNEAVSDWYFALPGNYADTDDYNLYYLDRSANGWSLKVYDASGDSWAESTLVADGSFTDATTVFEQMAGACRFSNGRHYVFGWNNYDNAAADLVGFEVNGSSVAGLTNVVTNSDDAGAVAVMIDNTAGRIYVFYLGKSDGSQVIGTTPGVGVYYKYSDDWGSSWSAEQTLFDTSLFNQKLVATTNAKLASYLPVLFYEETYLDLFSTAYIPDGGGGAAVLPAASILGGGL